ncbi:MAG: ankyrin repeat domain-containing protein [Eubacteriales bacterium]|nr:ankyrin repeat domain-containing protein [Eubacteriales bacterium]
MSEISYSNVPPMMAAIKSGDIKALRSLLHAGHSPNEPQCYQVTIGAWPREEEVSPLELAVLENRMDMVQLLMESGADLTHNPEELLYGSLRSPDLTLFSFLVDAGIRIPAGQRDICRLFLHLADRHEPDLLPILKRLGMDLKQYGGEALRSMASHGNLPLVEYLIQNGADINYHKPDMVFPYASTPVTEAARHNDFPIVRWLVEQGADITIPDKYGDRPYTVVMLE